MTWLVSQYVVAAETWPVDDVMVSQYVVAAQTWPVDDVMVSQHAVAAQTGPVGVTVDDVTGEPVC